MKNKDKYKEELKKLNVCDIRGPWYESICKGEQCTGCLLRLLKWCEEEELTNITFQDEEILKALIPSIKYIARDKSGVLLACEKKPKKGIATWIMIGQYYSLPCHGVFDWIQFEDSEPVCIDDYVER